MTFKAGFFYAFLRQKGVLIGIVIMNPVAAGAIDARA